MAHVFADLVHETTTTTGTGALTLDGAASGIVRAFSDVCSNGDTAWVATRHQSASEWEICLGTWATGGILTRTTVIQSSNGGSAVNFSAGTKDVYITAPADKVIVQNGSGVATIPTPFTLGAVSVTATGTELNYVAGVTSAIQTQIDAKAPSVSPSFTTPALGTPSSGTLTNCTGLPLTTGITGTLDVGNGGTGRATGTTAYALVATGTTATGAQQTLAAGATTEILVGGGASALPVWTAATGSGAPVRATSPTLVTPLLGTPTSGTLTNCSGLPLTTGVTGILPVANGGTNNAFFTVSGPATSAKTYTFPNASCSILTDNAVVTVGQGGTGRNTGTTAYALVATGTTATGAQQTLAAGATTEILVGGGASALPVWTTATGSGAPVRATSPTLTTPTLGVATATSVNKVALTAPATGSTLTIADGKTLTASNTLTLTATDGSTLAVGAGGTLGTGAFNPHIGYHMMANGIVALDPADSTTYYYGSFAPLTSALYNKIYVPKAGTVKIIYIFITNTGTAGTGETSTISFRLNNTTDTTVTSSVTTNAAYQTFSNTGLSISVAAGDYFEFKWVSPAYVTNPTQIRFFTQVYIE